MSIEVVKPGLLTTPQDSGRAGFAHLGVGRAGAFDAPALRIANALAGNHPHACALEITLLGPTLRFHADAWIALTGAPLPARIDDHELPMWSPRFVPAGSVLTLGGMRVGCRAYLAVRGGIDLAPVLGSRSFDVNAALGPLAGRALRTHDVLPIGRASTKHDITPLASRIRSIKPLPRKWSVDRRLWFDADPGTPLRLLPGTHTPLLDTQSRVALYAQTFRIGADSNRVGCRLEGNALTFSEPIEMVSGGCVAGTVQLPPSGQPIALGVEHPVSGGYPRIGQIAAIDLPRLAQRRPGDAIRFAPCDIEEAMRLYLERERLLHELETAIAGRLAQDA